MTQQDNGAGEVHRHAHLDEVITVLLAPAPDLREVLRSAGADGVTHLILAGRALATARLAEQATSVRGEPIDAWHPGRHHETGGGVHALTEPDNARRAVRSRPWPHPRHHRDPRWAA